MTSTTKLQPKLHHLVTRLNEQGGEWWNAIKKRAQKAGGPFICIRPHTDLPSVQVYHYGGCISKITAKDGLRVSINPKYILGGVKTKDGYVQLDQLMQVPESVKNDLNAWSLAGNLGDTLKAAERFSGDEKSLIHKGILAKNGNIIDLEIAFKAGEASDKDDLRIDFATLRVQKGQLSVHYFEVKTSDDPRVKSRGGEIPEVIGQLANYRSWLADEAWRKVQEAKLRQIAGTVIELGLVNCYNRNLPAGLGEEALFAMRDRSFHFDEEITLVVLGAIKESLREELRTILAQSGFKRVLFGKESITGGISK